MDSTGIVFTCIAIIGGAAIGTAIHALYDLSFVWCFLIGLPGALAVQWCVALLLRLFAGRANRSRNAG